MTAFVGALCCVQQPQITFIMALCRMQQSGPTEVLGVCCMQQTPKTSVKALCCAQQIPKTIVMALCCTLNHGHKIIFNNALQQHTPKWIEMAARMAQVGSATAGPAGCWV